MSVYMHTISCNLTIEYCVFIQILWEVDTILFSLLVLRGLSDSQGRVWRCHPNQLYAIEVTLPNMDTIPERDKKFLPQNRTLALLELMPSVSCLSPRKAYDYMLQVEHKGTIQVLYSHYTSQNINTITNFNSGFI